MLNTEAVQAKQARLPYVCPKCGISVASLAGGPREVIGTKLAGHLARKHEDSLGRATLTIDPTVSFVFTFLQADGSSRWLVVDHAKPWMISTLIKDEWRIEWHRDGAQAPVNS